MSKKKINARYGFSDLIIDKDVNVSKYVQINVSNSVKIAGEVELYLIGYEDSDGEECNEDGTEL
jgi:hypothetical protein